MTTQDMGAYLRREAAAKGYGTLQAGSLFVRVTRHGANWALELCGETPIDNPTIDSWFQAVGIPVDGTMCGNNKEHTVWRCEWTGTEDAAADGTPVFRLGGAK